MGYWMRLISRMDLGMDVANVGGGTSDHLYNRFFNLEIRDVGFGGTGVRDAKGNTNQWSKYDLEGEGRSQQADL